jgi:hypothetical protein
VRVGWGRRWSVGCKKLENKFGPWGQCFSVMLFRFLPFGFSGGARGKRPVQAQCGRRGRLLGTFDRIMPASAQRVSKNLIQHRSSRHRRRLRRGRRHRSPQTAPRAHRSRDGIACKTSHNFERFCCVRFISVGCVASRFFNVCRPSHRGGARLTLKSHCGRCANHLPARGNELGSACDPKPERLHERKFATPSERIEDCKKNEKNRKVDRGGAFPRQKFNLI